MRRVILMLLLAVASRSAAAEWIEIGSNDRTVLYFDPSTIRASGTMAKMWDVMDFKKAQSEKGSEYYLSSKSQRGYDCKEERWRFLFFTQHARNMADGAVVGTLNTPRPWEPVSPETVAEALWKKACSNKLNK